MLTEELKPVGSNNLASKADDHHQRQGQSTDEGHQAAGAELRTTILQYLLLASSDPPNSSKQKGQEAMATGEQSWG